MRHKTSIIQQDWFLSYNTGVTWLTTRNKQATKHSVPQNPSFCPIFCPMAFRLECLLPPLGRLLLRFYADSSLKFRSTSAAGLARLPLLFLQAVFFTILSPAESLIPVTRVISKSNLFKRKTFWQNRPTSIEEKSLSLLVSEEEVSLDFIIKAADY